MSTKDTAHQNSRERSSQLRVSPAPSSFLADLRAGFLVFLIALPLCLGIALASGVPPIAGIFTAIVGGVVTPWISNSELTIKGPAAGLIVIVVGCVADFGGTGFADGQWSAADQHAYELTLGIAVAAAVAQIVFGVLRGGVLGEFFPLSAVHGMLAAIGIIIIVKQLPVTLGVAVSGGPLELIAQIPAEFAHANPAIAAIGGLSLLIMFLWPIFAPGKLAKIPAPVIVLLISIPAGLSLHLDAVQSHTYLFAGASYKLDNHFLVDVPKNLFTALTFPDFSGLTTSKGWYWVTMFAVIGLLESILSAKAVDLLDPWKRKTNLDRDATGVGIGNLIAGFLGGIPMISEIVRSRANIDSGARSRFANLYHGLLLLAIVTSIPSILSLIPLSALGAMLVYTGFRLAHPREFVHVYHVGIEQLFVFLTTLVAVLATDLLEGIAIGVGCKIVLHILNGTPVRALFRPKITMENPSNDEIRLTVHGAAIFTGWISLRRSLLHTTAPSVRIDLSQARLVDHTVMCKLHELIREFATQGRKLDIQGLDHHRPVSHHPLAARKRQTLEGAL